VKHGLKILFAGTPDFAAVALKALLDSEHDIVAVYTQPDRPAGRGRKLTASPVKVLAEENSLTVVQPTSLKDADVQQELANWQADLMVVVAYGLILPDAVLRAPGLGCINIHASLLPKWRGAAPIQRAILAGDGQTGITIMQMDSGLDTGDMLLKITCPINPGDTAETLHDNLAKIGAQALLELLPNLSAGTLQPEPQDETQASYAKKLQKSEAELNWQQSVLPQENRARSSQNPAMALTCKQGKGYCVYNSYSYPVARPCLLVSSLMPIAYWEHSWVNLAPLHFFKNEPPRCIGPNPQPGLFSWSIFISGIIPDSGQSSGQGKKTKTADSGNLLWRFTRLPAAFCYRQRFAQKTFQSERWRCFMPASGWPVPTHRHACA